MYFNYRLLLKALYLSLFCQPFHLKRWFYIIFFSFLYLFFVALIAIGRGLDHIFFPGFKDIVIKEPVFIIAPPRSGTSFLQKMLSLDDERFLHWKMYQTIFPSICYQKVFNIIVQVDQNLNGFFSKILNFIEVKFFGGWDEMHKMRMNEPEEDEALYLYAFSAEAIFMLFPHIDRLWEAGFLDDMPNVDRRKFMAYYRSCLQRHAYANGGNYCMLIKSTQSSGAVFSLLDEFPDARFITIIRHPYQSVASHVSLFMSIWQIHSSDIIAKDGIEAQKYAALALAWYKHLLLFRSRVRSDNYYCVDYKALEINPGETVKQIYAFFNWKMSLGYSEKLLDITEKQQSYKSRHEYSLEEFGLTKQWIHNELENVFSAYSLIA